MWKSWEISNFELLMWLNIFGNRSYNDLSQYPVFPWILSNYEDPLQVEQKVEKSRLTSISIPEVFDPLNATFTGSATMINNFNEENEEFVIDYQYRDMNLPMGMLQLSDEGIKRKEEFDMNYETLLELADENNKPYVFGSNYSNPIYVCNYLMRLFPFTHISIELQGQGFDKPDRLFLSVKNSFFNSTSQKGDVRELIPEFFFLPEMFRNINKLNMGKLENGNEVNDVDTPCHNNPYDFIMTMKSVLESNKVSYTIQYWIDLIFGYKQYPKDLKSLNAFEKTCNRLSFSILNSLKKLKEKKVNNKTLIAKMNAKKLKSRDERGEIYNLNRIIKPLNLINKGQNLSYFKEKEKDKEEKKDNFEDKKIPPKTLEPNKNKNQKQNLYEIQSIRESTFNDFSFTSSTLISQNNEIFTSPQQIKLIIKYFIKI